MGSNCRKCGIKFNPIKIGRKGSLVNYCSLQCRNSHARSDVSKKKTSDALKNSDKFKESCRLKKERAIIRSKKICCVCGDGFVSRLKQVKTCSRECVNFLLSIKRQERLMKFNNRRECFEYKGIAIECDSYLEKAGVIYLKDVLGALKIERYKNILNYWMGEGIRKTFNPDFWIQLPNNRYCIVEVKMKHTNRSVSEYNRTIPFKREVLKNFCNEKGYDFIWLDFDYDKKFKSIYLDILKNKKILNQKSPARYE